MIAYSGYCFWILNNYASELVRLDPFQWENLGNIWGTMK